MSSLHVGHNVRCRTLRSQKPEADDRQADGKCNIRALVAWTWRQLLSRGWTWMTVSDASLIFFFVNGRDVKCRIRKPGGATTHNDIQRRAASPLSRSYRQIGATHCPEAHDRQRTSSTPAHYIESNFTEAGELLLEAVWTMSTGSDRSMNGSGNSETCWQTWHVNLLRSTPTKRSATHRIANSIVSSGNCFRKRTVMHDGITKATSCAIHEQTTSAAVYGQKIQ